MRMRRLLRRRRRARGDRRSHRGLGRPLEQAARGELEPVERRGLPRAAVGGGKLAHRGGRKKEDEALREEKEEKSENEKKKNRTKNEKRGAETTSPPPSLNPPQDGTFWPRPSGSESPRSIADLTPTEQINRPKAQLLLFFFFFFFFFFFSLLLDGGIHQNRGRRGASCSHCRLSISSPPRRGEEGRRRSRQGAAR